MIMSGVAWITSGQARKSLWIETLPSCSLTGRR